MFWRCCGKDWGDLRTTFYREKKPWFKCWVLEFHRDGEFNCLKELFVGALWCTTVCWTSYPADRPSYSFRELTIRWFFNQRVCFCFHIIEWTNDVENNNISVASITTSKLSNLWEKWMMSLLSKLYIWIDFGPWERQFHYIKRNASIYLEDWGEGIGMSGKLTLWGLILRTGCKVIVESTERRWLVLSIIL